MRVWPFLSSGAFSLAGLACVVTAISPLTRVDMATIQIKMLGQVREVGKKNTLGNLPKVYINQILIL